MISSVFLVGAAWHAPVGSTIVRRSTLVMSASQDLAAERYWLDQDEIVTLPPPDVAEAAEQVGRLLELGHGLSPPKRVVIKRDRMPNALTISLAFVFAAPAALVSTIHLVLAPPLASVATSARARVATFLATLGVELGRRAPFLLPFFYLPSVALSAAADCVQTTAAAAQAAFGRTRLSNRLALALPAGGKQE